MHDCSPNSTSTVGSGFAGLSALLSYHVVARISVRLIAPGLALELFGMVYAACELRLELTEWSGAAFEQLTQASGQLRRPEGRI